MRRAVGGWLLAAGLVLSVPAAAWELPDLMAALAEIKKTTVAFREEKTFALLQEPLVLHGEMHYRAPHYLKKQVLAPYRESYEIAGEWLTIDTAAEGRRQLSLRGHPAIGAFVGSFRALLAGDLARLERYYTVRLQGDSDAWQLFLEPHDRRLADRISAIIVSGRQAQIVRIDTLETDGDRSVLTLEPVS